MGDLDGRVAVVTGGGSGIGAACVAALRAGGARVGVLDLDPGGDRGRDLDGDPGRDLDGDPGGDPGRDRSEDPAGDPGQPAQDLLPIRCDLADDAAVRAGIAEIASRFGRIDILVNNAGISAVGTVEENADPEWARVLDINVVGVARTTRAALPHLRRSDAAAIVNLSSIAAWAGVPHRALYSATKGAVHSLTLAMAADLVTDGVRVNCVCPGTVDTPWVARLLARTTDPAAERERLQARQPMGRLVTAEEVAEAICYLAGPRSGATTGTALAVDGGMYGLRLPSRA